MQTLRFHAVRDNNAVIRTLSRDIGRGPRNPTIAIPQDYRGPVGDVLPDIGAPYTAVVDVASTVPDRKTERITLTVA